MTARIAINGFGRIGRGVLRAALAREDDLEIIAVNDLADAATLAHLLKFDSNLGTLPQTPRVEGDRMSLGETEIRVLSERSPEKLPWGALGIDVVIESTGRFTDRDKAEAHLTAGARRVIISAPASNADLTIAYGVNHDRFDPAVHTILSNASCTTNCLAPMAKVLDEAFGVVHGTMLTVHAYTQDQNLQDGPHRDLRRARAAAQNLVPTSTGAAKSIGLVLPSLKGRLDGYALRIPTPVGSLTDLTVEVSRDTDVAEVNAVYAAAADGALRGVLDYTEAAIVSSDIVGSRASCIFDAGLTKVIDSRHVKICGWYDNETGFSNRLLDTALHIVS
ncbi:type I glyceraldehyde-3-phosphate dehydrogenase [Actinocrinis puniceicyclus]|uniref:Glyceraldehyde-3-phosphate dehydrogenase n=1 Tax=Actinocrinis puniceicyclus TaxID=977794 RepID=A0A8J7WTK8_9ACTN|nr:type I glyceraldehyde-3-phosphate dehydrogenase [Actinocrinis puniceicyclus]MBS2965762.1 type I glyceraldehyde-3-phosphate dehydrogenase [Actinocrinis puniceicyclus]